MSALRMNDAAGSGGGWGGGGGGGGGGGDGGGGSGHVYDELDDASPRGFSHEVEAGAYTRSHIRST